MRTWSWMHKWSSLICTPFMLMLCITGLPLIFHEELHHLTLDLVEPAPQQDEQTATLDTIVRNGLEQSPGQVAQYIFWDDEEPRVTYLIVNSAPDAPPDQSRIMRMDSGTGAFLDQPDLQSGFVAFMLQLHTDMFAGLPGKLFLGAMGILFCISVVSGVVVYGPSMRKLSFGDLRLGRIRLIRWLDLHNLAGILLIAWTLVVGFTGVINTWADLVLQLWRFDQLHEMLGEHRDRPRPATLSSVDEAVAIANEKAAGMRPSIVAYPGTPFSSTSHYVVFMKGVTPLTSRLAKPVIVDAETSKFTASRDMPWYVTSLFLSQPLHFGDYGGMTLKIIWAILDIATIIVLVTGLYLWIARRGRRLSRLSTADKQAVEPILGGETG